jgi:hypothetical protein
MFLKAMALAALVMLAAAPARADTAAQAAQTWGLIGIWQPDCAIAPSSDYPRNVFAVRNGALFLERYSGAGGSDSAPISGATIRQDGALVLTINFVSAGGLREWVVVKGDANRFRTLSNRSLVNGVVSVRDGRLVANGEATPWNHRCQSGR